PCGPHFGLPVTSPSGHAAAAVAVFGGLCVLAARLGMQRVVAIALACVCAALAVAVGLSRVLLHKHNVPEVLIGGTIGLTAPLILLSVRRLYLSHTLVRMRWLAAAPLAVAVLFVGGQAGAEPKILRLAHFWADNLKVCQARRPGLSGLQGVQVQLPVAGTSAGAGAAPAWPFRLPG
ncbi:phosphatase PAP2 family protein, partial [Nostoc sp. NIES-2111]